MKKTLFIQIDNTPAPVEAENDYIPLDCKQINDFCSFVGDTLIGDLKDGNGTPLYRLINPAGRLLSDFEKVDKANYDLIITQWLDILGEILHKGVTQCDEQFTIRFPQQYTDWLLCNQNDYYVEIGKSLQANDGKVYLDADGISEDIVSALHMKITRFMNDNKDEIEHIVFSNERIGNVSYVVKRLKTLFDIYLFVRLGQWVQILREEHQQKIVNLEDYRAFWLEDLKLGTTKYKEEFEDASYSLEKYGLWLEFDKVTSYLNRIWQGCCYTGREKGLNWLLSVILSQTINDYSELSYNDICNTILHKGFKLVSGPETKFNSVSKRWYLHALFIKDMPEFDCQILFGGDADTGYDLISAKQKRNTIHQISVRLK